MLCRLSSIGQIAQLQQLTALTDLHLDANPLGATIPATLYRSAVLVVMASCLTALDGRQVRCQANCLLFVFLCLMLLHSRCSQDTGHDVGIVEQM